MKNAYNTQELEEITYLDRRKSHYKYWFYLVIIGVIVILCKFKFYTYQELVLIKDLDNYVVISNITNETTILNNKYLYINNKKYKYKITNISTNYNSYDNNIVESIYLKVDNLVKKDKVVDASILINKKTLIDMIIEFTKGG